jgi:hypothetical protein
LEYRQLVTNAMLVSLQAERDLFRSWLEFQWIDAELTAGILMDMLGGVLEDGELAIDGAADLREKETPEEVVEEFEELEDHLVDTAADLYIDYYAYRVFAHEQLGVSLETLLGHSSQHAHVVGVVEEALDRCEKEGLIARANGWVEDMAATVEAEAESDPELAADLDELDVDLDLTLDDLAESRCEALTAEWEESV